MKVRIFFDGQNFYRSLQRFDESLRVDYDRLALWITQQVGGGSAMFGVMVNRALSGIEAMPLLGKPETTCCSQFHTVWIAHTPHSWLWSSRTL